MFPSASARLAAGEGEARPERTRRRARSEAAPRARLGECFAHGGQQPIAQARGIGEQQRQARPQARHGRLRIPRLGEEERSPQHLLVAAREAASARRPAAASSTRPATRDAAAASIRPCSGEGGAARVLRGGAGHLRLRLVPHPQRQHGRGEVAPPRSPARGARWPPVAPTASAAAAGVAPSAGPAGRGSASWTRSPWGRAPRCRAARGRARCPSGGSGRAAPGVAGSRSGRARRRRVPSGAGRIRARAARRRSLGRPRAWSRPGAAARIPGRASAPPGSAARPLWRPRARDPGRCRAPPSAAVVSVPPGAGRDGPSTQPDGPRARPIAGASVAGMESTVPCGSIFISTLPASAGCRSASGLRRSGLSNTASTVSPRRNSAAPVPRGKSSATPCTGRPGAARGGTAAAPRAGTFAAEPCAEAEAGVTASSSAASVASAHRRKAREPALAGLVGSRMARPAVSRASRGCGGGRAPR